MLKILHSLQHRPLDAHLHHLAVAVLAGPQKSRLKEESIFDFRFSFLPHPAVREFQSSQKSLLLGCIVATRENNIPDSIIHDYKTVQRCLSVSFRRPEILVRCGTVSVTSGLSLKRHSDSNNVELLWICVRDENNVAYTDNPA